MNRWIDSLRGLQESHEPAMLVTVMNVRGSAPRERGAKMLVTASEIAGTIGGGRLEHECTRLACNELIPGRGNGFSALAIKFPLGAGFGQCCGGVVEILFERVDGETSWVRDLLDCHEQRKPAVIITEPPADGSCGKHLVTADSYSTYGGPALGMHDVAALSRRLLAERGASRCVDIETRDGARVTALLEPFGAPEMSIALFGAGHTGSAVVAAMAGLDCEIRWIDSRRRVFPAAVPGNVVMVESGDPVREIAAMPRGAFYLVMTHSHPLDYDICDAILRRGDFAYLGLIGSRSKRRRFEQRMKKIGMAPALLERLTCPIGIRGVGGKRPAEIAIAVSAELLRIKAAMSVVDDGSTENNDNVHVLHRLKGESQS
jgi:xanthine dehydrogenase accessory factor